MRDKNQWLSARRELFLQVQDQVRSILGEDSPKFRAYREQFEREFKTNWSPSSAEDLLVAIQSARIIYLADFHALKQSQRSHLRLLSKINEKNKQINIVMMVEFIEAKHQKWLDDFQRGSLTDVEFKQKIQWEKSWGFPWENYKPLLDWARKAKVKVLAINLLTKKRDAQSLHRRDIFSAKLINQALKKYPDSQLAVIFGDLHLAKSHLPKHVNKVPTLTYFQNSERIYFQILKKNQDLDLELVRLSKNRFCLLNVPPWVKWQNYLMYLENQLTLSVDQDDVHEYTDSVAHYVKVLAKDLKFEIRIDEFSVYTAEDSLFWDRVEQVYDQKKMRWIQYQVEEEVSFYLPDLKIGFLARPSVNHAAALAMSIVHAQVAELTQPVYLYPKDFLPMIWQEAVKYFGSKLINPKRKTDTFQDMRRALTRSHTGERTREALRLALAQRMQEILVNSGELPSKRAQKIHRLSSPIQAAQLLGNLMGEKLFYAFQSKRLKLSAIRSVIMKDPSSKDFAVAYYELVELIDRLPEPFATKTERL